jgi:hypothetical protein
VPTRAIAQAPAVSFSWSAPAGCPDAESVRSRARSLAGAGAAVDATAEVTRADDGFHVVLHVRVNGSSGERTLTAPSCADAAQSVAAILALAASTPAALASPATSVAAPAPASVSTGTAPPPAAATGTAPLPVPSVATPPPPASAPSPAPAPAPTPALAATRSRAPTPHPGIVEGRLEADAACDIGTLPSAAFGGEVRVSLALWRRLALGLAAGAWLQQSDKVPGVGGASYSLLTFDASGCYELLRRGTIGLSPCLLVELGRIAAQGFDTSQNGGARPLWAGVGLGARGRWEAARWLALVAEVDGVAPTARQEFSVGHGTGSPTPLYTTSLVAARIEIGPEVRF